MICATGYSLTNDAGHTSDYALKDTAGNLAMGAAMGAVSAVRYAKANDVNLLTGYDNDLIDHTPTPRANAEANSTIYRAVSQAEVDDIANFGFRTKAGGYETGKLFAPTIQEATQYGKYNFGLDGVPNTIMKVQVPNSILNGAYHFGADGMNAISIPEYQLKFLKGVPLNYSPINR